MVFSLGKLGYTIHPCYSLKFQFVHRTNTFLFDGVLHKPYKLYFAQNLQLMDTEKRMINMVYQVMVKLC